MSTWKLPDELKQRIIELQSDLSSFTQEMRDAFEERSEKWRNSESGDSTGAWIEELDGLADALDNISEQPV